MKCSYCENGEMERIDNHPKYGNIYKCNKCKEVIDDQMIAGNFDR